MKKRRMPFQYIHFVGIKGVAMAAMAIMVKEQGVRVTGSDVKERFVTDDMLREHNISWNIGFRPEHVTGSPDLVIVTGAHSGMENIEAKEAKRRGLTVVMQGEAVGIFMKPFRGISVCGCHGKTTTTAMIATVLDRGGMFPSFIVGGGNVGSLGVPARFDPRGEFFVAEADEYLNCPVTDRTPKFLFQSPEVIVATNIEYDHPDAFATFEEVKKAYRMFFQKIPKDGLVVGCLDDATISEVLFSLPQLPRVTYGRMAESDFHISDVEFEYGKTVFTVTKEQRKIGAFELRVPGVHNALNATAAIAVGLHLGVGIQKIKKGLMEFTGTMRRFEYIGKTGKGVLIYDDYAHHPTEIKTTLQAARQWFGKGARLIAVFQPHTYSRTKALFQEFVHAFSSADQVIIADIYASAREKKDETVSSRKLVEEMKGFHPNAAYIGKMDDVIQYLAKNSTKNDVILTMGAGDIFHYHKRMLEEIR